MRVKNPVKKNRFRAFSLIELSVVVTIVAVALALFLSTKVGSVSNQRILSTHDRIAIINKALEAFVAKNKRLPCPARIDLTRKDAAYGEEVSDCASGISVSGNRAYGMVPVKALGLSLNTASDGFGNKFGYVVDTKFKDAATNPFLGTSAGEIAIKSFTDASTSADINPAAVFAIISHGANGNYSYGADSATPKTPTTPDVYEQRNSAANFNGDLPKQIRASATFDDIVFYKDKTNFLLDAKVSNLQNSNATGNANTNNSGCPVSVTGVSVTSVPVGISSLTCDTSRNFSGSIPYNCDAAAPAPITGSCGCAVGYASSGSSCVAITCTITGNSTNNLNSQTVGYAATSTAIPATACATGYTGSPTYTCTTNGAAASISGTCTCDTANNYALDGGVCKKQCVIPNGTTGFNNSSRVFEGTTSLSCNAPSFFGSIDYTCSSSGALNISSNTCVAECTTTGAGITTYPSNGKTVHTFTGNGTLVCPQSKTGTAILVVGGGGGGGTHSSTIVFGGGGGGGGIGYLSSTTLLTGTYQITVGAGGAAVPSFSGGNGGASSIISGSYNITANGGSGGAGQNSAVSANGGSTGGTGCEQPAGSATKATFSGFSGVTIMGNKGGRGNNGCTNYGAGGGGGATGTGGNFSGSAGGNGGAGFSIGISGADTIYGAGGGGGGSTGGIGGGNASSGAGNGKVNNSGKNAAANRGGGGGGMSGGIASGAGGSGVVIISY